MLELVRVANAKAKIVVHRDRDYLTNDEAKEWETQIRKMSAEPFLTDGVDIESHFLDPKHLAELNGASEVEIAQLVDDATSGAGELSIEKYVNGRTDHEKKQGTFGKLNVGQLATVAPKNVASDPKRFRYSKAVLKEVKQRYQTQHSTNLRIVEVSPHLSVPALGLIARKI